MSLRELYDTLLQEKRASIDHELKVVIADIAEDNARTMLWDAVRHGRRFRPLLLLCTCEGVGGDWRQSVTLACAMELLHKASLLHDDLVDEDTMRRGVPAFWAQYGAKQAVIVGDVLVSLSLAQVRRWGQTCAHIGYPDILHFYLDTLQQTALGELLDLCYEQISRPTQEAIIKMLEMKSGNLIATSLAVGAIAGGAPKELVQNLKEFGQTIGIAFQMLNDLNNVTGLDLDSKGSWGHDLMRGKKTLPTLLMQEAGVSFQELLCLSRERYQEILQPAVDALTKTLVMAQTQLTKLPEGPMQTLFQQLIMQARQDWFWIDTDVPLQPETPTSHLSQDFAKGA